MTNGYRVAHHKGDIIPLKAMEKLLIELDAEVPPVAKAKRLEPTGASGEDGFACRRCGGGGPVLPERPFKGELGEQVLATVCEGCWGEWVAMGTRVINELRMPMHDPEAQATYDRHMKEFLLMD